MAELSRLKKRMLCTFIVALASFVVMFYYSVSFSEYKRLGVKYVTKLKNGNLGRDLIYEQALSALSSNDSSASSSNLSHTGESEEGKINTVNSIEPSVRSQPTEKKSIMPEDKTALQSTGNSLKSGSTYRLSAEATKPTTSSTARQPILTASNTQSSIVQKLCPEKSSSLGESLIKTAIRTTFSF